MKKTLFLACAALTAFPLLAVAPMPTFAAPRDVELTHLAKPTSAFNIGVIFFKMVGAKPDFTEWVKKDPRFSQMDPIKQKAALTSETERIEENYASLKPETSVIVIRSAVNVNIEQPPGGGAANLNVKFPVDGAVYFPYQVGDQTITVIPNGIELYNNIPLSPREAETAAKRISLESGRVTMVVEIKPVKADGNRPVIMDGIEQWLMIGEIGFIGFYNEQMENVWAYQAPWHSSGRSDLKSLQKLGPSDSVPEKP